MVVYTRSASSYYWAAKNCYGLVPYLPEFLFSKPGKLEPFVYKPNFFLCVQFNRLLVYSESCSHPRSQFENILTTFKRKTPHSLPVSPHTPPPFQLWTNTHLLSVSGFACSAHFIEMESDSMWPFVGGLSHPHVSHCNNTLLHRWTTLCLSLVH